MKIFISADIEGITGITHWDEATKQKADYQEFRKQMTAEVAAACEAAIAAGATEIYVKDAHATGRNLVAQELPESVRLIRGWSGHPASMVQQLDESFHAAMMIGYHAGAGADTNTLAHTMTGAAAEIRMNGQRVTEFMLHTYTAALHGVPVVFVSGDEGLCTEASRLNPAIQTAGVNLGVGDSTISIHPRRALTIIREGVKKALSGDISQCQVSLPRHFDLQIEYKTYHKAYRASFFPGVERIGPRTVELKTGDFFEVMRALLFVL